ncbi:MAG: macro domain-containing protein [Armatimonadaceae bacterium]
MSTDSESETPRVIRVVYGNLLTQGTEIIVHPWNRNLLPAKVLLWLFGTQGITGELRQKSGGEPFRELAEAGPLLLGDVVLTGPGRLPYIKGIIHVALQDHLGAVSTETIRLGVQNTLKTVNDLRFRSIAFPLLGAGSLPEDEAYALLKETLIETPTDADVLIVRPPRKEGKR